MPIEVVKLRGPGRAADALAVRPPQQPIVVAQNTVWVTGRVSEAPELRTLSGAGSVCHLRLAVQGMGRHEQTGFIDVQTFGETARACSSSLSRGWIVAVSGRLRYGTWESAAGVSCSGHTLIADVVTPVWFGAGGTIASRVSSDGTIQAGADAGHAA